MPLLARWICVVSALALAGCGGRSIRTDEAKVNAMSISEAYRALREGTRTMQQDRGVDINVSETALQVTLEGRTDTFPFRNTPKPVLKACRAISNCVDRIQVWINSAERRGCCHVDWLGSQFVLAQRFQTAFARLAIGFQETPEEAARFAGVVADVRRPAFKLSLPEEARRYRVSAEAAISEKRFDDAADHYEDALKIAPWWPEGHFNRALVLGEAGRSTEAIAEMKKYLQLVPDAANTRQAQDQVYKWEEKISR